MSVSAGNTRVSPRPQSDSAVCNNFQGDIPDTGDIEDILADILSDIADKH